jgi:Lactonase, 7-bladed beta-propeller
MNERRVEWSDRSSDLLPEIGRLQVAVAMNYNLGEQVTTCCRRFASRAPRLGLSVAGSFMILLRIAFVIALLVFSCMLLSCQGKQSNSVGATDEPSSQILYVIGNGIVSTYAVDTNLEFTSIGQPVTLIASGSLVQFVPAPNGDFLYVLWSDARNQQHLSVYVTDTSGVPQTPAVQTVDAPSLYQFNIHRSARFVYMMQVSASGTEYTSAVRLFYVDPSDGKLSEDPRIQGRYGPSDAWPASLYGFSADGTKIYLSRQSAQLLFYEQRVLNTKTGTVGPDVVLYQPVAGALDSDTLVIGARVMVDEHRAPGIGYLDVLPLVPRPRRHLFRCAASMLALCETSTNVQIDPSGKYLFLTDPSTEQVHAVWIDLNAKKVEDTGNSIPMTAETPGFAFSPDGKLVYAVLASDSSVHVYSFDSSSGQLTDGGSTLPIASTYGFCPATRR